MFHFKTVTPVLCLIFASLVVGGRHGHGIQRRIDLCGGSGYDLGTNAYFYLEDSSLSAAPQCGARCQTDPECKTYAVGKGACLFYNTTLTDNARSDTQSPNKFYDRNCVSMTITTTAQSTPTTIAIASTSVSSEISAPITTAISSAAALSTGSSSVVAAALTNSASTSGTSLAAASTSPTTPTTHSSTNTTHTSSASTTSSAASSTVSRTSSASNCSPNNILHITVGLASFTLFSLLTCI